MNCASTSGRGFSVENAFLRGDVRVQLQQSAFKPVQALRKQRALVCSAVAGRQLGSPVFRALFQLFRVPQVPPMPFHAVLSNCKYLPLALLARSYAIPV